MIGLEYICKLFDKSYKDLAKDLDISPKTLNDWVKQRRKIPQKYLPQLSKIFHLKEEYFQKELTNVEKLQIQRTKIDQEAEFEEIEVTEIDDEGNEYTYTHLYSPQEYISDFLYYEEHKEQVIEDVRKLIDQEDQLINRMEVFEKVSTVLSFKDTAKEYILLDILNYLIYRDGWGFSPKGKLWDKLDKVFKEHRKG